MNKTILVTGAGSGIGFALSLELARRGHTVIAVSRTAANLARLSSRAQDSKCAGTIHPVPADITREVDLNQLTEQVRVHGARLEGLVNCAGRLINRPFGELTSREWEEVYRTNVFAVGQVIRFMLPFMERGADDSATHIVNVSSMGGVQGSAKFSGLSAYSSSKAAVCGLTECLAEELKPRGVRVNALAIGSVRTEMFAEAFPGFTAATTPEKMAFFMADFVLNGQELFNGKILQVSASTP